MARRRIGLARAFEDAVAEVLLKKTLRALEDTGATTLAIGGGVSAKRSAELERAWNRGELPVLLGHPQAMAQLLVAVDAAINALLSGNVAEYSIGQVRYVYSDLKTLWELRSDLRSRVGASRSRILLADEPVSALDVSVRAQVLNLITDLVCGFCTLAVGLVFVGVLGSCRAERR